MPTDKIFFADTLKFLSKRNLTENDKLVTNPTFYFEKFKLFKRKYATNGRRYRDKNRFSVTFAPAVDSMDTESGNGISYDSDIYGRWKIRSRKSTELILKRIKGEKIKYVCKEDIKVWKNMIVYKIVFLDQSKMVLVRKLRRP